MISISHKHKAIFFHIPKTAGTYVEFILAEHYDFNRVSTICDKKSNVSSLLSYEKLDLLLNEEIPEWKKYFKFAFIRNPYDRAISSYEYIVQKYNDSRIPKTIKTDNISFQDFYCNYAKYNVNNFMKRHAFMSQYECFKDIQMDYYATFENLHEEIDTILQKLGITDCTQHLYLVNYKLNSSLKKDISLYYDDETLKKVNELFKDDFLHLEFKEINTVYELNTWLCNYSNSNI